MRASLRFHIFLRKAKSYAALLAFLCRHDRHSRKEIIVTLLAGFLLFFSAVTFHSWLDSIGVTVAAATLGLQLGWPFSMLPDDYRPEHDDFSYSAETTTEVARGGNKVFPMSGIAPAAAEAPYSFYNPIAGWNVCPESPLVSNAVDDFLMTRGDLPYKVGKNNSNYVRSPLQLHYLAIRVGHKVQNTQNLRKIEFYGTAADLMGLDPITVRPSSYFSALMTAEAFRSRIYRNYRNGEKELYANLTRYFPAVEETIDGRDALRLAPDFYKQVSGRIGVTTLLLTENRRVAMLHQGASKPVGGEQINLGGSGSMNFSDIEHAGNAQDFRDVISYAMTRELCEETGMKPWFGQAHINTMLIGFFRWIDRAGHPEFLGITHVRNIPFSRKNNIDGDEVVKYEEIPVSVDVPADFRKVMEYVRENRINVALSSLMALHRLTVIAGYNTTDSTDTQKKVYRALLYFLDSRGAG